MPNKAVVQSLLWDYYVQMFPDKVQTVTLCTALSRTVEMTCSLLVNGHANEDEKAKQTQSITRSRGTQLPETDNDPERKNSSLRYLPFISATKY